MRNFFFYFMTVLIWGTTWIGIKLQLGLVDPMVSVGYRFALAALLLLLWCRLRKLPMRFSPQDHFFMALQGVFLFSLNYLFFYLAELYLTSGLAAVIFSTILLMNMLNGTLFLAVPPRRPWDFHCLGGLSMDGLSPGGGRPDSVWKYADAATCQEATTCL